MSRVEIIENYEDSRGNRIIGKPRTNSSSSVRFGSSGCTIEFGDDVGWYAGVNFLQPGGHVKIGGGGNIRGGFMVGTGSKITIGQKLDVTAQLEIITEDNCEVSIGSNCLFASRVALRAYDNHPIYDLDSRERINYSRDIEVGDDVWLGAGVTVLGGSTIARGSVVGTSSVVTSSHPIPEHVVAAGIPALVKRERIAWMKPGNPPLNRLPDGMYIDR